jgi:hypothetical protein
MNYLVGSNNESKGGLSMDSWRSKGGLTSISTPFRFDENGGSACNEGSIISIPLEKESSP